MTWPTIKVMAGYGLSPTSALPAIGAAGWTEVTDVSSLRIMTPRRDRFADRTQPGRLIVTADNSSRQLDPFASGSQLIPRTPLRCFASVPSIGIGNNALSTCYLDSPEPTDAGPNYSETVLSSSDATQRLASMRCAGTYPEQLTSDRVTAVLNAAGWPVADRVIGDGYSWMRPVVLDSRARAWTELDRAREHEHGLLYLDPLGRIVLRSRTWAHSTPSWIFSDAGGAGVYEYEDVERRSDTDRLLNFVQLANEGSDVSYTAQSTTSINLYGEVAYEKTDWQYAYGVDLEVWAGALLQMGESSIRRFATLVINPTADDALWTPVLTAQLGQRVQITYSPPGGGAAITRQCFIDHMSHDIAKLGDGHGTWITRWELSDATDWPTITVANWDSGVWGTARWFY